MSRAFPGVITEIEGMRGILSMIVLSAHVRTEPPFWFWGYMEIFFCISGFVITRLLLVGLGQPGFLKKYFMRRILRIWPVYYATMLFALAAYYISGGATLPEFGFTSDWQPNWQAIVFPLIFIQNSEMYFGGPRFDYLVTFQHSWTVAVEEQYYLIWPLLMLVVIRRSTVSMRLFWAFLILALAAIARWKGWFHWLLITRIDGFVLGGALAYLEAAVAAGQRLTVNPALIFRWLWIWPILALVPYMTEGYFGMDWGLSRLMELSIFEPHFNVAFLSFCWLGHCVFVAQEKQGGHWTSRVLNLSWLQYLGNISYSTYMAHLPIIVVVTPYLMATYELPAIFVIILGFGLSIALAHLAHIWIERPTRRLKRYFSYKSLGV